MCDVSVASWSSDSEEPMSGGAERRGRDRARPKRKTAGRASSIDFIRKVPVSPFHRDNNDQQHDSLERQRLNHTIRARSKSSSHALASRALFCNSAHSKPQSKIQRNSSEPLFDTQIPLNYVRNLARRFQSQEVLQDDPASSEQNVVLVSMTETGEQRREADNQISYIEVPPPEPPMSISSVDSESDAGTGPCAAATVIPRHAICASAVTCQAPGHYADSAHHSAPRTDSAPYTDAAPYTNSAPYTDTVKGIISSDSSDSVEKPNSRVVRGRYKSYLRDTMQFSFYTGEKAGHPVSSDDSVYLEPHMLPASPVVSDVSTSGCSSGTDDQSRARWTDGSCSANLLSYSSPPRPHRNSSATCLNSRGHVHTNGCYGQRQRSVSPDKRPASPFSGDVSRSLPALPVTSDMDSVKQAKDPKVILRAAHLSNELVRLTGLLERLHPHELQSILLQRLRQRDSKAIVALGVVLPRTCFPSTEAVHCVRCHKNYDLRQTSACTLKHPPAYVVKTHEDSCGASFYCKACDGQFLLQGMFAYDEKINSYMAGFCFNGKHTTNPAHVNFSGIVKTCEEQGCVECYV